MAVTTGAPSIADADPPICKGGKGTIFPLGGQAEAGWNDRVKVLLYGTGLLYCFLGVGIVADIFMSAIERVTSKKKLVKTPGTDRIVTKNVWNETVANLTLMALGSSAPEILLAINDVFKNNFFSGALGPATIVGSAAFNLFIIIAVCINAIPGGETRVIKEQQVFVITAVWSIFAYVWLLVIVSFISSPVIEVWEGVMTVGFFPALVWMSWASDVGILTLGHFAACCGTVCCFCCNMFSVENDRDQPTGAGGILVMVVGSCCSAVCSIFCKMLACIGSTCCCCFRRNRAAHSRGDGEGEEGEEQALADEVVEGEEEEEIDMSPILDEDGEPIDCEEGVFTFKQEVLELWVGEEELSVVVPVLRKNGTESRVSVQFRMESITATPGYDYEEEEGQLDFKSGVNHQDINLVVLPKVRGEVDDVFQIILDEPDGGAILDPETDGGEDACILTVRLRNKLTRESSPGVGGMIYGVLDRMLNVDELWLGTATWKDQIIEAVFVNGSFEEQSEAGWLDWVSHFIGFPWKILYALFTPPPVYVGGWPCFVVALMHIGFLTSIIGDLAELFGCSANIDDAITAITFVALGTSLPDTFASKTAATQDEYADASIVNVTGSNSVNVFLGIGLPWCIAGVKWQITGPTDTWMERHGELIDAYPNAGFIVNKADDLAFSVLCFTISACICLLVIHLRRVACGGELGGPSDIKASSSFLLFLLWVSYIGLQIWKTSNPDASVGRQLIAFLILVPIIFVLMILFLLFLQVLKVSKKYIGEEGFWGIFVAACLISLRIVVFFMFQVSG
eukprot:TRINITY_DN5651_c0_g1_i2.p1 TRINITY_DN5651_c0_g1~~TRINITY_DN5651_c0_g1_i2.p1  ORF type:complete len:810 (-),score=144.37 TRINITY_DN5651_c0_g1_i2:127-2508(-)